MESNNLPTKLALPYHPRSSLINNLIYLHWQRSRLKTGAVERSEEKQSHVVALYKQLGVWGAL